jgi:hypothetical protein
MANKTTPENDDAGLAATGRLPIARNTVLADAECNVLRRPLQDQVERKAKLHTQTVHNFVNKQSA